MTDKFRHDCWEWDGMSISSDSIELTNCLCFDNTPEFNALKEKLLVEYDKIMEGNFSND